MISGKEGDFVCQVTYPLVLSKLIKDYVRHLYIFILWALDLFIDENKITLENQYDTLTC